MVGRHYMIEKNLTLLNKVDEQNSHLNIIYEQERIIKELNVKIADLEVIPLLNLFSHSDFFRQISVC